MSEERVCLVVNPRSAAGATGRHVPALRRAADAAFGNWELRTTQASGHATALARQAVDEGFDVVVSVGGDGTANEVVNGLFEDAKPVNPNIVFAAVPAGTGSDLVKTLGMPKDYQAAMRLIASAPARPTDAVAVTCTDAVSGQPIHRMGFNVTGFGLNGIVVAQVNAGSKRLGGRLTFLAATLRALATFRPSEVVIEYTDAKGAECEWQGQLSTAMAANGQYCGGGMWMGRGSRMDDGLLALTLIPQLPLRRTLFGGYRLFNGTISNVKGVSTGSISQLSARVLSGPPVLVDVDGEQPGVLPVNLKVLKKVLLVRGEWGGG
jgi:diacylglycerol kinase family enzyme